MKSIIFLSLIILSLSSKKYTRSGKIIEDAFDKIKKSMYQCVSASEEASNILKEFVKKKLDSEENLPLNFNTIELTQGDREIIRKCKREALKIPTRKPDDKVIPISLKNIVYKKKVTLIKGQIKKPRKLELLEKLKQ